MHPPASSYVNNKKRWQLLLYYYKVINRRGEDDPSPIPSSTTNNKIIIIKKKKNSREVIKKEKKGLNGKLYVHMKSEIPGMWWLYFVCVYPLNFAFVAFGSKDTIWRRSTRAANGPRIHRLEGVGNDGRGQPKRTVVGLLKSAVGGERIG